MKTSMFPPVHAARPARGFTLIELLVVIAIIAILAGIALPVIGRVKQAGYQAKSISNLRQLSMAAISYAGDHAGWYPYDAKPISGGGDFNAGWRLNSEFIKYLAPVVTNSVNSMSVLQTGFRASPDPKNPQVGTLGYNNTDMVSAVQATPAAVGNHRALQMTSINRPSRLVFFAESASSWINQGGSQKWTPDWDNGAPAATNGVIAYRAGGGQTIAVTYGGNIIMFDKTGAQDIHLWRNYLPQGVL
ncbi:MAG: prepilin-type N-terminal cleavage/methylation domain-containing protein [Chthoniobacteraceae bacterium]